MIFAREVSPVLTSLVKKIDEETAKNSSAKMGSFVVFCNDSPDLEKQLKDLAEQQKLTKLILSIDNPAGPKGYEVAKDADVTIVFYNKRKVEANFVYRKGELKEEDVSKIVADLPKILK
jgi:hypothetical protein